MQSLCDRFEYYQNTQRLLLYWDNIIMILVIRYHELQQRFDKGKNKIRKNFDKTIQQHGRKCSV